jgi:hypothetical protein
VLPGVSITAAEVPRELLQLKEVPPLAVSVVLPPAQITCVPLMEAVGSVFTVTDAVSVSVQPLASVTVTVYEVVLPGVTITAADVPSELLQLNEVPPLAVSVVLPPAQITCVPLIKAVGSVFTVTEVASESVQPLASVTVTV